jgi:3-phosphoshikimate 1-carboxyvinyltransferase
MATESVSQPANDPAFALAAADPAPRAWPAVLTVEPIGHAQGEIRLPGSKSMSNRALLLAALAQGSTELTGLLAADDTRVMIAALRALGVDIAVQGDRARVSGCAGRFPVAAAELHLGNAGTAMRSLAAALAFAGGHYRLDGVARMRERPIGDLVEALNAMGARISYAGAPGFPPLQIEPPLAAPGPAHDAAAPAVRVRGNVSSQFLSGLLMAAPARAPAGGLEIAVEGELISEPYVAMTVSMMRAFGARVEGAAGHYRVWPGQYRSPGAYAIEGDASGASYFLALGAIAGGPVRVLGVGRDSLQGDLAFTEVLAAMGARVAVEADAVTVRGPAPLPSGAPGVLRAIVTDATAIPDAAMTAAVLALFAQGTTRIDGIGSWRVKETDRIAAMTTELAKLGAVVQSGPDWLAVTAPANLREAWIDTYDDHRMAMCLALAAARGVRVHIRDPGCVSKTFPGFFAALERLRAAVAP